MSIPTLMIGNKPFEEETLGCIDLMSGWAYDVNVAGTSFEDCPGLQEFTHCPCAQHLRGFLQYLPRLLYSSSALILRLEVRQRLETQRMPRVDRQRMVKALPCRLQLARAAVQRPQSMPRRRIFRIYIPCLHVQPSRRFDIPSLHLDCPLSSRAEPKKKITRDHHHSTRRNPQPPTEPDDRHQHDNKHHRLPPFGYAAKR